MAKDEERKGWEAFNIRFSDETCAALRDYKNRRCNTITGVVNELVRNSLRKEGYRLDDGDKETA